MRHGRTAPVETGWCRCCVGAAGGSPPPSSITDGTAEVHRLLARVGGPGTLGVRTTGHAYTFDWQFGGTWYPLSLRPTAVGCK